MRRLVFPSLCVVLVATVVWRETERHDRPPPLLSPPADVITPTPSSSELPGLVNSAAPTPAAPANTAPTSTSLPPLPDPALPLAQSRAALEARAQAGDEQAACRLALALLACSRPPPPEISDEVLTLTDQPIFRVIGHEDMIEGLARSGEERDAHRTRCGTTNAEQRVLHRRTAESWIERGSIRQQVLYALTGTDGSSARIHEEQNPSRFTYGSQSDPLISQFYASHAVAYLEAGLAQFDPLALEGMLMLTAPDEILPAVNRLTIRHPDPERFAGLALLYEQVFGSAPTGILSLRRRALAQMDPPRRAQIETAAAEQAARWRQALTNSQTTAATDAKLDAHQLCDSGVAPPN